VKAQKKLSNALGNARRMNLAPAYIKNGWIFVQGKSYAVGNVAIFQYSTVFPEW